MLLEAFPGNLVVSAQVHGTEILRVGVLDRGKGVVFPREMEAIDGLITDRSQVGLVTIHADCVPLFFLDPRHKAIGLAHAGWRGTVGKIGAKMIRRMQEDFGSDPADLLAAIGPSIGPCCFEVGEDVEKQFEAAFADHRAELIRPAKSSGKFYVDLWEANRQTMLSEGVLPEHITVTDLCTACHSRCVPFLSEDQVSGTNGGHFGIDLGRRWTMEQKIERVIAHSIGEELGIVPGDVLLEISGHRIKDVLDYYFYTTAEELTLKIRDHQGEVWEAEIEKEEKEDLGLVFEDPFMGTYQHCHNRCIFCFIDQMPKGMASYALFQG